MMARGIAGSHAGDQCVAPGGVASIDGGHSQAPTIRDIECSGSEHAAQRRECLRVAEHGLARLWIGKYFGEPRHRCDKFNAGAGERERAEKKQRFKVSRESGSGGGEGVDQNAVGENAAASETVGQIAAPQAAESADERWNPEQVAGPIAIFRRAWCQASEFSERGLQNERANQHDVNVEEEAHGGDGADGPFDAGTHNVPA